jgi:hypothetical protein
MRLPLACALTLSMLAPSFALAEPAATYLIRHSQ